LCFRAKTGKTLWQISFFDHILRTAEDLSKTAEYILSNPVRAGLVGAAKRLPLFSNFPRIALTLQTRWHES
jgi:putative transposase